MKFVNSLVFATGISLPAFAQEVIACKVITSEFQKGLAVGSRINITKHSEYFTEVELEDGISIEIDNNKLGKLVYSELMPALSLSAIPLKKREGPVST